MNRNTAHILLSPIIMLCFLLSYSSAYAIGNFIKSENNPVLQPGDYTWEQRHTGFPTIIFDAPLYKMWYVANDGTTSRIAYAFSNDGINWTKHENTVLEPTNDGWETAVSSPFVMKDGNQYKMWFTSINNNIPSTPQYSGVERYRIGYATSSDGLSWNRQSNNVLGGTKSWSSEGVTAPTLIKNNGSYRMWFSGRDSSGEWSIGTATSETGTIWNQYENNPILKQSLNWEGNHVAGPSVVKLNNQLYMFYHGGPTIPKKIGYATSINGIEWTKNSNQSIDIGQPGSFDSTYVAHPSILTVNNNLWMYYSGYNGSNWSIGLATTGEIESERNPVVIVPGMFASYSPKAFATCSKTNWQDWKLIPRVTEYNGLIKTLEAAGYILNQDLFIFPYDWLQKITDSGKDLKEFIDNQVSPQNPGKKIDLIGHSLGGLVARSYLQEYDTGLIDQIITVGSPHHGVLEAYRPWAGGELPAEESMQSAVSFITNVCKILTISPTKKDVVHKVAPVFRDLLPIYPPIIFNNSEATYLRDNSTKLFISKKLMADNDLLNTYLPTLNSNFPTHFPSFDGITSSIKQMPLVYDVAVYLEDELLEIYQLGRPSLTPLAKLPTEFGDGTVLKVSATFQNDQFYDLPYDHRGLIYSKKGIEKIVEILDVSPTTIVQGQPTNYKPSVLMLLRSPATLTVKDPDGNVIEGDTKFLFLPGYVSGEYEVKVKGIDSGGKYELLIGQLTENGNQWDSYQNTILPDQELTYKFQFDTTKPVSIPLIDLTAADHLLSARQKILNLQKIQDSRYLRKALRTLDRIEFLINKDSNRLAAHYTLRINRYLLSYKRKTDNIKAKNAALDTVSNLEAAYSILAQKAGLRYNQGRLRYNLARQYANITEWRFRRQAAKGRATSFQAAALKQGKEKLKKAEEALADNQFYRAEILSWSAFYLFKEAR